MSETAEVSKLPYPVRHGAVPTPDGVFPVDLSQGGQRRKRRPLFDLEGELAKGKVEHQAGLLELAWGIIANAYGGNWELAPVEWRDAATKWRDRYFADGKVIEAPPAPAEPTANLQSPENPDKSGFIAVKIEPEAPFVKEPLTAHTVFIADRWLSEQKTFEAFVEGLASFPDDRAAEILGHHWNRDEDSFLDAVQAKWNEFQIAQTAKNPPVIPPHTGGVIEGDATGVVGENGGETILTKDRAEALMAAGSTADLDDDAEDAPVNESTLGKIPDGPAVEPGLTVAEVVALKDAKANEPAKLPDGNPPGVELKNVAGETITGADEVAGPTPPKIDPAANVVPPPAPKQIIPPPPAKSARKKAANADKTPPAP